MSQIYRVCRKALSFIIVFAALLAVQGGAAWALDTNSKICFPWSNGVPYSLNRPLIDGNVDGDTGWNRAWRYAFNNGQYVHDAVVQGLKDANNIYLSFQVNNVTSFEQNDAIVVAIDPNPLDGMITDLRLIEIFPLYSGGSVTPVPIIYYNGKDDLIDKWELSVPTPLYTQVSATTTGSGSNLNWSVELVLRNSEFSIPTNTNFGLYFTIVSVHSPTTGPSGTGKGIGIEYPWPADSPNLDQLYATDLGDIATSRLPSIAEPEFWGLATIASNATCSGVYINPWDIRTLNNPPYLYQPV